MFMTTGPELEPPAAVELCSARFKIEVGFKVAARVAGSVAYHFRMRDMTPVGRSGKSQGLHRKSAQYREAVKRRLNACHNFMQRGIVAQGIMAMLSALHPTARRGAVRLVDADDEARRPSTGMDCAQHHAEHAAGISRGRGIQGRLGEISMPIAAVRPGDAKAS